MIKEPSVAYPEIARQSLQRSNALHTDSFVYFVGDLERKLVKIGKANDPVRRLKTMQTSHGGELKLLGCLSGGHDLEHELHQTFQEFRVKGEWFRLAPPIWDLIEDAYRAATNREPGDTRKPIEDAAPSRAKQVERLAASRLDPELVERFAEIMGFGVQQARRYILDMGKRGQSVG